MKTINKKFIHRIYMFITAIVKLITGIIGLLTLGFYIPKFELKIAMKYAKWNCKK